MQDQQARITVVAADPVEEGLVIYFSDQSASLFSSEFLYSYRNREGNTMQTDWKKPERPFTRR